MPDVLAPPATISVPLFDGRTEVRLPERLSASAFDDLCQRHPLLHLELDADGTLIVMPPTKSFTDRRHAEVIAQLRNWAREDGAGVYFGATAGFDLPNGARRGPDAAWVRGEVVEALSEEERAGFLPFCPDFVVELRSKTDRRVAMVHRQDLEEKMEEYLANGARLGWLIDSQVEPPTVTVYRPDEAPVTLTNPATVSGAPTLPGFTLACGLVFRLDF